jgi:hypothetical protein
MKETILISPTGHIFIVEKFGFYWVFSGLTQLGYWSSKKKMIDFYKDAFGFQVVGKL